MPLAVEEVPWDAPEVAALRDEQALEILERHGEEPDPPDDAGMAVLLLVRDSGGRAVACGGLRAAEEGACEMTGVFVRPYARSAGVGRMLVGALEARARHLGAAVVRADVLEREPEAAALFAAAGFDRTGDTRFERRLD